MDVLDSVMVVGIFPVMVVGGLEVLQGKYIGHLESVLHFVKYLIVTQLSLRTRYTDQVKVGHWSVVTKINGCGLCSSS